MAEYNPGLLIMQIEEQLDQFKDRVLVLTNAVQQLHHRRLAIDLLTPHQMDVLHKSVMDQAHQDNFNPLTTQIADYFQIEASYVRTDNDIVIIVHVPCSKFSDLLTIYRYLPSPIPIPILPHSHDITIAQSLALPKLNVQTLDQLFDQNDLDHQQVPEALFIKDNSNLIAIGSDDSFQVLSQVEISGCVQKKPCLYL